MKSKNNNNNNVLSIADTETTIRNLSKFLVSNQSKYESPPESIVKAGYLYPNLERKDGVAVFMEVLDASEQYANKLYDNFYKPYTQDATAQLASPVFPENTIMMTDLIRHDLRCAANYSSTVFIECTLPIDRDVFLNTDAIGDDGKGAVYAYFNDDGPVYVGKTGSKVKSRLHTPTSPHKEAVWWPTWTHMRFLPLKSASNRQILEKLLILGLAPMENKMPDEAPMDQFLKELGCE